MKKIDCKKLNFWGMCELRQTTLNLDLESGWRYGVTCQTAETDPADQCFGCRGSTSVALDPALGLPADQRLWLVWFGDPKDAAVLY